MMKNTCILFSLLLLLSACGTETSPNKTTDQVDQTTPSVPKETDVTSSVKHILFFGNSLTAAYGLDPSEGFEGLIQQKLENLEMPYRTINAGLSGETTAGGNSRVDWVLNQQNIDIFILELGGNDGLRGIDPKDSYKNLKSIIDKVRAKDEQIKIVLAGMEAPPNMGPEFTQQFRSNYSRLAKEYDLALIPFLLDKVGGVPELNQKDGIHPTAEGHKIVAENIWEVLQPLLEREQG